MRNLKENVSFGKGSVCHLNSDWIPGSEFPGVLTLTYFSPRLGKNTVLKV